MKIRKLQLTGKTSYMVSLPKARVTHIGLKEKSHVALAKLPDGSLQRSRCCTLKNKLVRRLGHSSFDLSNLYNMLI